MPVFNNALAGAAGSGGAAGYEIERSLRFNSGDSADLSKTFSSAGNRRTWTFSAWIKFCDPAGTSGIFECTYPGSGGTISNTFEVWYTVGQIHITDYGTYYFSSDARLRDPSAWGHLVIRVDTTEATAANRIRLYWNGEQLVNAVTTSINQNDELGVNGAALHKIGNWRNTTYANLYFAEIHHVDGQSLDPTSFGEFDADTGVWNPIEYTGTYGTNGFHLDFSDNSSDAALGTDSSGNSNTWTVNNITSVVANNTDGVNNVSNITQLEEDNIVLSTNITNLHSVLNSSEFQDADTDQTTHGIRVGEADKRFGIKWSGLTGLTGISLRWQRASTYDADVKVTGTGITQTTTTLTSSRVKTTFSTTSTSGELLMEDVTTGSTNGFQLRSIEFDGYGLVTYPTNVENFTFPGADQDSLIDSPTNYEADSGNNGGNYATWNSLDKGTSSVLSNGNLEFRGGVASAHRSVRSTIMPTSKMYAEMTVEAAQTGFGLANASANLDTSTLVTGKWAFYSGEIRSNGTTLASVTAASAGDIIQIAYDPDNNKAWIGLNNTWYSSSGATTGNPSTGANATFTIDDDVFVMGHSYNDSNLAVNFGARPFAYTPPTGFKSLCTQNLDDPLIAKGSTAFDILTWEGQSGSGSRDFRGLSFTPSLAWVKTRSQAYTHVLWDSVRGPGVNKELQTDSTNQEGQANTSASGYIDAFVDGGFDTTAGTLDNDYFNRQSTTYVAWNWDAGSSTVSNTDGDITSSVRANPTAGFSIVKWTTPTWAGSSGRQVGHGLGAAPAFIITKGLTTVGGWYTYHKDLDATNPNDYYLTLNTADARGSLADSFGPNIPNSTTFGDRLLGFTEGEDSVAFCFAPVEGYSAFGSYTGNGSADGPFVYTGFKTRWLIIKSSSNSGEDWLILDTARDTYNDGDSSALYASLNHADNSTSAITTDILSNGFKCIGTNAAINASGYTYIYAAFAENPFKISRAR